MPASTLWAFLLVLARVAGVMIFVPLPGTRAGADVARALLALGFTLALFSRWPRMEAAAPPGRMAIWLAAEAFFGLSVGLALAFLSEALLFAAEVIGLQAGYGYAWMVDPATEAGSGVLVVFARLAAGLLFFALGLDREVIRILAAGLEAHPPGSLALAGISPDRIIRLGAGIFSLGLRLALPVVALLLLVDTSLALLSRLQAQLQILAMAFPVKMLAALALLAWVAALFPRVYRGFAGEVLGAIGN